MKHVRWVTNAAEVHVIFFIFRVVNYPEGEQVCSSKMLESHAKLYGLISQKTTIRFYTYIYIYIYIYDINTGFTLGMLF